MSALIQLSIVAKQPCLCSVCHEILQDIMLCVVLTDILCGSFASVNVCCLHAHSLYSV